MVLKFCANLSFMFTEKTDNLLERYQLASQAGFKAVEFTFPYQFNVEDVVKVNICSIQSFCPLLPCI
jgi:hydroxypyruvate isomerase